MMDYGEEPTKTSLLIGVNSSISMMSTPISSPWQTPSKSLCCKRQLVAHRTLKLSKPKPKHCLGSLMGLVRSILQDIVNYLSLWKRTTVPRMVQQCSLRTEQNRTEGQTHIRFMTLVGMTILLSHMISIRISIPSWLTPPGPRPPSFHMNAGTRFPSMAAPSGDNSPLRIAQPFSKDILMTMSLD